MHSGRKKDEPAREKSSDTTCSDMHTTLKSDQQKARELGKAAERLLDFRLFALENDFKYLSHIIEPVVRESLQLLYGIDKKYQRHELTEQFLQQETEDNSALGLSGFELECMKWCSVGKSPAEIAREISVTERVVVELIQSVKEKIGTASVAHSVAHLVRQKVL